MFIFYAKSKGIVANKPWYASPTASRHCAGHTMTQ